MTWRYSVGFDFKSVVKRRLNLSVSESKVRVSKLIESQWTLNDKKKEDNFLNLYEHLFFSEISIIQQVFNIFGINCVFFIINS